MAFMRYGNAVAVRPAVTALLGGDLLKKGDHVVTANGRRGIVVAVGETEVNVLVEGNEAPESISASECRRG